MREIVAIIGGGVAGLSAAQELVQRGFAVHVYERRPFFGGKAASYRVRNRDGAPAAADPGRPGEHGFRFFPSWYRHLIDTMSRIPYHRPGGGRHSVADNLVSVQANLLAWFDRAPVTLPLHLPRDAGEASVASHFLDEFGRLGLSSGEVALFFRKLVEFVVLSDEKRVEKLEGITWWDYLECSQPGRSRAYKDLVRATTRTMVAAKAEEASAFSIGRVAVRTFLDTFSSIDRVLNGPTNEVWVDPWVLHLEARGVVFHPEMELLSLQFDANRRRVRQAEMAPVPIANIRRLRRLIARNSVESIRTEANIGDQIDEIMNDLDATDWLRRTFPEEWNVLTGAVAAARAALVAAAASSTPDSSGADLPAVQNLETLLGRMESDARARPQIEADYFVLALPLEQLAYYVNRTTMLTFLAPELRNVVRLARHMDWMAGIQFYLRTPLDIAPGHLVGMDSTWALTAIEQTQFWKDVAMPPGVRAILSVDIAAWDRRGRTVRKEAFNCTADEIAREVWAQLGEMLNKNNRLDVLRSEMLVDGDLIEGVSYHLDDSIVDLRDRKKQAAYERARGVDFNTVDLVRQDGDAEHGTLDDGYMFGRRLRFNAEPLLVNRAGSHALRPEALTSIPNLFLAGDFVRTETDLACMEGANEAARRAVNGVLDAAGSREPRCEIWPFSPSRDAVEALMAMTGAVRAVGTAAAALSTIQDRFWKTLAVGMLRIQNGAAGSDAITALNTSTKR
jgi:uncharacterized protein with NAD-binding domain and iron-sulfur cluster